MDTVTEISAIQFLKKYYILTNATDFLASGNHFLPFSQTAVNCCECKQFILQLKHSFQSILFQVVGTRLLSTGNGVVLFPVFFSQRKLLLKFLQVDKNIFDFIKDLLKRSSCSVYWKLSFHYPSYG